MFFNLVLIDTCGNGFEESRDFLASYYPIKVIDA